MILLGFATIVPLFVMDGLSDSYWKWILMGEIVLVYTIKLILWGLYDAQGKVQSHGKLSSKSMKA